MEYVHIIVARQMGKTCLLRRLAARLEPEGYLPVKIDLSRLAGMEMNRREEIDRPERALKELGHG
jgi:hypothetical protein